VVVEARRVAAKAAMAAKSYSSGAGLRPDGGFTVDGLRPGVYRIELTPMHTRATSVGGGPAGEPTPPPQPILLGEVEVEAGVRQSVEFNAP
jgi:hypothetical protein